MAVAIQADTQVGAITNTTFEANVAKTSVALAL